MAIIYKKILTYQENTRRKGSRVKNKSLIIMVLALFGALAVLIACSNTGESSKMRILKKDPPTEGAAAKIFGELISVDDLEKNDTRIYEAKLELFNRKRQRVEAMVHEKTFEKLAEKKKMTVDEFLQKEQERAKKLINNKQVTDFLTGKVRDPKNASESLKDRVKGILHLEKLVSNYTRSNPVEFYLKRPRASQIDFDFEGVASYGDPNAKVTVVEFSDFQCPYCGTAARDVVAKIKQKYGKRVRVVFKHFPLEQIHPDAKAAHMASMCVHEQDTNKEQSPKFWKFHDIIFANQENIGADDLNGYAKQAGVDIKKYEECVAENRYQKNVERDLAEARKIGVNSTPTFYINSQPILGARSIDDFAEIIDEEMKMSKTASN